MRVLFSWCTGTSVSIFTCLFSFILHFFFFPNLSLMFCHWNLCNYVTSTCKNRSSHIYHLLEWCSVKITSLHRSVCSTILFLLSASVLVLSANCNTFSNFLSFIHAALRIFFAFPFFARYLAGLSMLGTRMWVEQILQIASILYHYWNLFKHTCIFLI